MEELAETALKATLADIATTAGVAISGVWKELVPQGKAFPAIVFQLQSGLDHDTHDGRSWIDARYLIKAVGEGYDERDADKLALAIDQALRHQDIPFAGGEIQDARRVNRVSYTETKDGKIYRHRGGSYRMMITFS